MFRATIRYSDSRDQSDGSVNRFSYIARLFLRIPRHSGTLKFDCKSYEDIRVENGQTLKSIIERILTCFAITRLILGCPAPNKPSQSSTIPDEAVVRKIGTCTVHMSIGHWREKIEEAEAELCHRHT